MRAEAKAQTVSGLPWLVFNKGLPLESPGSVQVRQALLTHPHDWGQA